MTAQVARGEQPFRNGNAQQLSRWLRRGATACLIIAVANTIVHGVVMDEAVVPAQIIAGQVTYPDGHPQAVFYRRVFTAQNYTAAWFLRCWPSVKALSFFRNVAFVFVSLYAPFLATILLTRSYLWATLATTVLMTETIIRLGGLYPIWVYPHFYGHGHFGLQISIIGVAFLWGGYHRLGSMIIGLIPAVHAAMAVVTWPWVAIYAWCSRRYRSCREILSGFTAFGVGVALCIALASYITHFTGDDRIEPPYDVAGPTDVIYSQFSKYSDGHRKLAPFWTLPYVGGLVAYLCIGALMMFGSGNVPPENARLRRWIILYGAGAWALVIVAWLWHFLNEALPYRLNQMMPYRFNNLPNTLLIPMTVTVMADTYRRLPAAARTALLLLVGGCLLGAGLCIPVRRGHVVTHLLPMLWGIMTASYGFAALRESRGWLRAAVPFAALVVALGGLAVLNTTVAVWSFAFGYLVTGLALMLTDHGGLLERLAAPRWTPVVRVVMSAAFVLVVASTIGAAQLREITQPWAKTSEDERLIAAWLKDNAQPQEMILPPLTPSTELQAKTEHPVMMEFETLQFISYDRDISAAVAMMARDLYGLDYSDPAEIDEQFNNQNLSIADVTQRTWEARTTLQWQDLQQKYGFRLVVAPVDMVLSLPRRVTGERWALHEIPPPS